MSHDRRKLGACGISGSGSARELSSTLAAVSSPLLHLSHVSLMLLVVPQHLASLLLAAMVAVVEELQVVVGDLQQGVWAQRSLIPLPGGDSCLMLDTISSTRPPPQREVAVGMVMCTGDSDARLTVEVGPVVKVPPWQTWSGSSCTGR